MAIKTSSLPWLGVTTIGMIHAGQIIGLLEAQEILIEKTKESVANHSFSVAVDITDFLIQKITPATDTVIKEYFTDREKFDLISWVKAAMTWTKDGVLLGSTSLVEIKKSDLVELKMNKQQFLDYLNKVWSKYVILTDWPDTEETVNFFFKLQT